MASSPQKYSIIYNGSTENVYADAETIRAWIDEFLLGMGVATTNYDEKHLLELAATLKNASLDFPHTGGFSAASPFKKVGYFFVQFLLSSPLESIIFKSEKDIPKKLADLLTSQEEGSNTKGALNAMVAFEIARNCLVEVHLTKSNGLASVLKNKIRISQHYYYDFLDAYRNGMPSSQHYLPVAILFESLAYLENPEASYPRNV